MECFPDKKKIPCLLIENKSDELSAEDKEDMKELEEFSNKNGFTKCFRTSAKDGTNVKKAMEFLIKNIDERIKNIDERQFKCEGLKERTSSFGIKSEKPKKKKCC